MLRVTFKNLLARKFRLVLTSIAVVLGVAFMAGTFVLTDTLGNVFDGLFADIYRGVDVGLRGKDPFTDVAGGPGTAIVREPLDESLVEKVAAIDGVRLAEGKVASTQNNPAKVSRLNKRGKAVEEIIHGQAPQIGVTWGPHRAINRAVGGDGRAEVGRRPVRDNEVALDEVTAKDAGLTGAEVRRCANADADARASACRHSRVEIVFNEHEPTLFRVVAIFKFGTVGNLAGATLAAFDLPTAQSVLGREGKVDEIHVKAAEGVSQGELRDRIRSVLRQDGVRGIDVLTGKQLAKDQSDEIRDNLKFFNIFLLVFALVAVFVGAFIIYNTFSIIVAQRTHELGLLRGLGASGGQVRGSVTLEAFVIGLLSSLLGLIAGVGIAIGLQQLLKAFDVQLPSGNTVILARTVIVSMIVGTVVTVVSAIAPARRAAKVSPVAAMQADATGASSGRRRYYVGGLFTLVGAVGLGLGLFADVEGFPGGGAAMVGLSCAAMFIGVSMVSPLVAQPVARVVGWLPARLRGTPGVLARENATRNPRRTATTAAALMIGIALLTLVAIIGASIRSTFGSVLENNVSAEVTLRTKNFLPFTPEAAAAARKAVPGSKAIEFRFGQFAIGAENHSLLGISTNVGEGIKFGAEPGSIGRFRDGGLLISEEAYRKEVPRRMRQRGVISMRFGATGVQEIPIAGTFSNENATFGNEWLLSLPLYKQNYTDQADVFAFVKLPEDTPVKPAIQKMKDALEPFTGVVAENQEQFKKAQEGQISQFLNLINVLLFFAVIIAILGVANTLALSIFERTHELGLLRAVGMSRRQVRTMIRYESVVISVFGALLGIAIGLVFGRALVGSLENEGIDFALSGSALVILVVIAIVAGFVAAWGPARRASHLDILQAIHTH